MWYVCPRVLIQTDRKAQGEREMQVVIEVHEQENAHREGWIDIQKETEREQQLGR